MDASSMRSTPRNGPTVMRQGLRRRAATAENGDSMIRTSHSTGKFRCGDEAQLHRPIAARRSTSCRAESMEADNDKRKRQAGRGGDRKKKLAEDGARPARIFYPVSAACWSPT